MRRVAVVGATGKMGSLAARTIADAGDLELAGVVSRREPSEPLAGWVDDLERLDPEGVDVVVDLTIAEVARRTLAWATAHGRDAVIGTSGLLDEDLERARRAAGSARILVVPNFSVGAVLCQRFAQMAAPHFGSVEVVELHHDRKRDAPSGTSIAAARAIAEARAAAGLGEVADPTSELGYDGARGAPVAGGVRVHSLRLEGLLAHQEIHFGGPGEGLVLRHDTTDRTAFMGGLLLALRRLEDLAPGVSVGLGQLV